MPLNRNGFHWREWLGGGFLIFLPLGLGIISVFSPLHNVKISEAMKIAGFLGSYDKVDMINDIILSMIIFALITWTVILLRNKRNRISVLLLIAILVVQAVGFILAFAGIYRFAGLEGVPPPVDLFTAVYFSIVTWTTLGYGDFQPSEQVRLFAAGEALLGYLYLGLIVGLIVNFGPKAASGKNSEAINSSKNERDN